MSLGARDSSGESLVERAVNKLSKKYGVLFVVAAGNDFIFDRTVGSPASAEAALAVGALDSSDLPADFSQRGRLGELSIKPELVAPGVDITGALSHFIAQDSGAIQARDDAPGYGTGSRTSMAAPHVSGAVALLSQRHPDWKGDQLKAVLMGSAKRLDGQSALEQGAGLVDIPAALELELHAEPAAVSFGTPTWPHDDDTVREQKVSLYNDTDSKVTLGLTLEASKTA
jgi:subtilisin family serine protease